MLEHGGRLRQAAVEYGIPLADWLDLSTGINPQGWPVPPIPVPPIPAAVWARLPEEEDGLAALAARVYGAAHAWPVAGSQAAIQALPTLRAPGRVGVVSPGYAEHAQAWAAAGHEVVRIAADAGAHGAPYAGTEGALDVVVLIHPNNPGGQTYVPADLLALHERLAARGGWLLVDEAFMDCTPQHSLAAHSHLPGLIVLRSLGKFYGLAGARVGFVLAAGDLLDRLAQRLGPWCLSGPSRWVAAAALADADWQAAARPRLLAAGARLADLLLRHGLKPAGGTALFQWVRTADAALLHAALARRGILTRLFGDPPALRFGLPGSEAEWQRLEAALREVAA